MGCPWSIGTSSEMTTVASQSAGQLTTANRKTVVQDVEEGGGRRVVNFKAICDANTSFYGRVGSDKRRKFQKIVSNLKLLPITSYVALLKRFAVPPAADTAAQLESPEEDNQPAPAAAKGKVFICLYSRIISPVVFQ
jgi:hypothetical protein